ncbi:MAG: hypothetical protein H6709_05090 [Kofleriaceae bacterium]|nr:hypothetical protein [Myxococcales bacterium]MCB9559836.1 hypothetical protein [Kofleriaceae bacterium]MCB9571447.1 hypothetical protein [Kofleriaceae bacterium]
MKDDKLLQNDPLSEAERILSEDFYGRPLRGERAGTDHAAAPRARTRRASPRPTHYKVICISMYTRDIEELEAKVAELKRRGWTKANKSQLIRMALSQMDLDKLRDPER